MLRCEFKIKKDEDILKSRSIVINSSSLQISVTYDDKNNEHKKIVDYLDPNRVDGLLTTKSASLKFGILFNVPFYCLSTYGSNIFTVNFPLAYEKSNLFLIVLSMLDDAIRYLKNQKADIPFDMMAIFKALAIEYNEYNKTQETDCAASLLLNKITNALSSHPGLTVRDAILLFYALLEVPDFEIPLDTVPNDFVNNIIKQLDSFFIKSKLIGFEFITENNRERLTTHSVKRTDEFVEKLILMQKIKLYDACLGKPARGGNLYNWNDTEWHYLSDIKCSLNNKNRMAIENNHTNPSYQLWYAVGQRNHDTFSTELNVLFPYLGLEMEPDIDPHKSIIFSEKSTEKLFNMGLHLGVRDDIKKLLKARNGYHFFVEASKSGDFHDILPKDVIKLIYAFVYGFVNAGQLILNTEVDQISHAVNSLRM